MEKRIRPLKQIKTKEEYEEYQKCRDSFLVEYEWYESHGKTEAISGILEKAKRYEKGTPSRIALENRARLIQNDEYVSALERNIVAYQVTITQYEAKEEGIAPLDVLKGLLSGDDKIKSYLKRRSLKEKLENNGFPVVEPIDLSLQSTEDAIRQVFEECDFINIPKVEYSLVPVNEKANVIQKEVMNVLKECLNNEDVFNKKEQVSLKIDKSIINEKKQYKEKEKKEIQSKKAENSYYDEI